jgi:hypothetical protein
MWNPTGVMLCQSSQNVIGNADVEMHESKLSRMETYFTDLLGIVARLHFTSGFAEARLRPSGYGAAAFATMGLAEPKLA